MQLKKAKRTISRNISVFTSLFASSMFIMLVPIAATIMVVISSQIKIANQLEKNRQNYSHNINEKIESMFISASDLAYKISIDTSIINYAKSSTRNYWTEYEIIKYLKSCIDSNGDIRTCYIYLPQHDLILSDFLGVGSQSFYNRYYNFGYEKWVDELNITSGKMCVKYWPGSDLKVNSYSLVIKTISLNTTTNKPPVVVVQMNDNAFSQKISNTKPENNAKVLVYNNAGIIMSTFDYEDCLAMYKKAIADGSPDTATITINKKAYQIIKNKADKYDFSSIYAAPVVHPGASLKYVKVPEVLSIIFCLVLTIICCIAVSKRHSKKVKGILSLLDIERAPINEYAAIEALVKEYINNYTALTETVNKDKDALQVMFLEKLLLGNIQDVKSIEKYMEQYRFEITGEYYALALYTLSDSQASSENDNNEGSIISIAKTILTEAFSRLLSSDNIYYIADFNNYIVCILNFPERALEQTSSALNGLIAESVIILNNLQQMKYTASVSSTYKGAARLKDAYAEALNAIASNEDCLHEANTAKMQPGWVEQCVSIIEQNYHDINLSTSYIADKLRLARPYLSSSFKQYTGTGLHDKILEYRIMMAREMIQDNPDILIMEVAKRTGFNNVASFIRSFKKLEGVTPGELKNHLENVKSQY